MGDHNTEEYQQTNPYPCDGGQHSEDAHLVGGEHVGDCGDGEQNHYQRNQRVTAADEYILEGTLTVEQSGQAPVCKYKQEQRNQNGDCLRPQCAH